jgi:hypothetical protein
MTAHDDLEQRLRRLPLREPGPELDLRVAEAMHAGLLEQLRRQPLAALSRPARLVKTLSWRRPLALAAGLLLAVGALSVRRPADVQEPGPVAHAAAPVVAAEPEAPIDMILLDETPLLSVEGPLIIGDGQPWRQVAEWRMQRWAVVPPGGETTEILDIPFQQSGRVLLASY